jgi:hypothetical protein
MAVGVACRDCGVILPERPGRCPACGARSRNWGLVVARVGMGVALAIAFWGVSKLQRPRVDPTLVGDVQAYPGISRLGFNDRGTDVTAFIDNKAKVPVDVTLRLRALDIADHVSKEVISGPHRLIAPGSVKSIEVSITTTPIAKWEVEIIDLAPSPPPQ